LFLIRKAYTLISLYPLAAYSCDGLDEIFDGGNLYSPAMLVRTADAPSLALTGISRDTLGHSG
jgi:hypothetical protein